MENIRTKYSYKFNERTNQYDVLVRTKIVDRLDTFEEMKAKYPVIKPNYRNYVGVAKDKRFKENQDLKEEVLLKGRRVTVEMIGEEIKSLLQKDEKLKNRLDELKGNLDVLEGVDKINSNEFKKRLEHINQVPEIGLKNSSDKFVKRFLEGRLTEIDILHMQVAKERNNLTQDYFANKDLFDAILIDEDFLSDNPKIVEMVFNKTKENILD